MKSVNINPEAIREYCKKNKTSLGKLSAKIGRGNTYLYQVNASGKMREATYNHMLKILDLPQGTFLKKEDEPLKKEDELVKGYHLSLKVLPGNIKLEMSFEGKKMYDAYAYIKENSEVGLMQAISFAANVMYKKAEATKIEGVKTYDSKCGG